MKNPWISFYAVKMNKYSAPFGIFIIALRKAKNRSMEMWIVLFIVAVLFVLGSALILLKTAAKMPKIPDNVKSQPYDEDNSDDW